MRRPKTRTIDGLGDVVRELVTRINAETTPDRRPAVVAGLFYILALRGMNAARRRRENLQHEALRVLEQLNLAQAEEARWLDAVAAKGAAYASILQKRRTEQAQREREQEAREHRVRVARECGREWTLGIGPDVDADDLW